MSQHTATLRASGNGTELEIADPLTKSSAAQAAAAPVCFASMVAADVEAVVAVENNAYAFPWTRGNFLDSLASGHQSLVMRERDGPLAGYFLQIPMVDEIHLLNITVRPDLHGQGMGRRLLEHALKLARNAGMQSMLLEVRPSNHKALAVYEHVGFVEIGIRKNYYPAPANSREDAIVMRLPL